MRSSSRISNDALSLPFPAHKIPAAIGFCTAAIVLYTQYLRWGNALASSIDIVIVLLISGWILILPPVNGGLSSTGFKPAKVSDRELSGAVIETTSAELQPVVPQHDTKLLEHWSEDKKEVDRLWAFLQKYPSLTWQDFKPTSGSTFLGILKSNPRAGALENRTKLISDLERLRKQRDCTHIELLKVITAWRGNCSRSRVRDVLSASKRESARIETGDQKQI